MLVCQSGLWESHEGPGPCGSMAQASSPPSAPRCTCQAESLHVPCFGMHARSCLPPTYIIVLPQESQMNSATCSRWLFLAWARQSWEPLHPTDTWVLHLQSTLLVRTLPGLSDWKVSGAYLNSLTKKNKHRDIPSHINLMIHLITWHINLVIWISWFIDSVSVWSLHCSIFN